MEKGTSRIYLLILMVLVLSVTISCGQYQKNTNGEKSNQENKSKEKTVTKSDKWKKGNKGLVRWRPDCDFFGYSFGQLPRRTFKKC